MQDGEWLTTQFEAHRSHLREVAYRLLGSVAEADEAVQDTWIRVARAGTDGVENLGGWMTTITARICLNMLRARTVRREEPLGLRLPDPIVTAETSRQPDEEVQLADSVGLALLIIFDALDPAERLAYVLHDMFGLPFVDIGRMLDRSPTAARKLASRARTRVREAGLPDPDRIRERAVVDAFFEAARRGDFAALIELLHPDVVMRSDFGAGGSGDGDVLRGAAAVATQSTARANPAARLHRVLVSGAAGVVVTVDGRPTAVIGLTVADGRILHIDVIGDPERVPALVPPLE